MEFHRDIDEESFRDARCVPAEPTHIEDKTRLLFVTIHGKYANSDRDLYA